ncbi:stomatin/prohibitin-family membrane protease [Cutibacterium acnes JCM 18909]|nr:stomatin/prohibitin-family membrane protease [Cutibacterium acnes JCM 18909]
MSDLEWTFTTIALVILVIGFLISSFKIIPEYERGVVFRLGKLRGLHGSGLVFIFPGLDKLHRVDQRTVTLTIPPQEIITRDNVPARVNAVVLFNVTDPMDAVMNVENYAIATSQIAQTTLRSVLGRADLDTLLAHRRNSTRTSVRSSRCRRTRGVLMCPSWRLRTWRSRRRCSGPWPVRRRRSGSGGRKSSTHAARCRRPASCGRRPTNSRRARPPCSCGICRRFLSWEPIRTRRSCSHCPWISSPPSFAKITGIDRWGSGLQDGRALPACVGACLPEVWSSRVCNRLIIRR